VKNLAMMRARSVTSSTDLTEDVASASSPTAQLEANEGGKGSSSENDPIKDVSPKTDNTNESIDSVGEAKKNAPDATAVALFETPVPSASQTIVANESIDSVGEAKKNASDATAVALFETPVPSASQTIVANESIDSVGEAKKNASDASSVASFEMPVPSTSQIIVDTPTNKIVLESSCTTVASSAALQNPVTEEPSRTDQQLQAHKSTPTTSSDEDHKSPTLSVVHAATSSTVSNTAIDESLIPTDSATPDSGGTLTDLAAGKATV
jgi:hypothetical protein